MAFGNAILKSNIRENWLVQLGYYNGRTSGNGDGGFSTITQVSDATAPNLLKGAITDAAATNIDVDTAYTFDPAGGDYFKIDDGSSPEIVRVTGYSENGVQAVDSLTPTPSAAWATLQNYTNQGQTNTSAGSGALFDISTDGSGNPTFVIITTERGQGYTVDDTLNFKDPISKNTAALVVSIVTATDSDSINVDRGQMGTTAAVHDDNAALSWVNFIPIAFSDTTYDDVFYRGAILNRPSIREAINLSNSSSMSSNMSLTIADFSYKGYPVSQELFGGTREYINYEIRVYSQVEGDTAVQIGSFRLNGMTLDGNKINLSISQHRPWDLISIPADKTTIRKNYIPVIYGNYVPNVSSVSTPAFCPKKYLHPVPVEYIRSHQIFAINHDVVSSDGGLHYYEKEIDVFVPFNTIDTASQSESGANLSKAPRDLDRRFLFRPTSATSNNTFPTAGAAASETFDTDTTSDSEDTLTLSGGSGANASTSSELQLDIPSVDGDVTAYKMDIKHHVSTTVTNAAALEATLGEVSYGSPKQTIVTINSSSSQAGSETTTEMDLFSFGSSKGYSHEGGEPSYIAINFFTEGTGNGTALATVATAQIHDVTMKVRTGLDHTANPKQAKESLEKLIMLYSGADGFTKSWSSGTVTEIHEAHRDLLIRFSGMTTATPTGWSDIESSKDWKLRYWQLEPIKLSKLLEKLQMEGGFCFRMGTDGLPQYIHIEDSYTASDVNATLTKMDINSVSVKHTPFSDVVTKMNINYRRHPAEKKYITSVTASNANTRKNTNILDKENIKEVNLDAYVGDTGSQNDIPTSATAGINDDWYTYYDNILGAVKIIVSCTIVNPKYYDLAVGSTVIFSDMIPDAPFGYNSASWDNLVFMITSTSRSPGEVKIHAREIYTIS